MDETTFWQMIEQAKTDSGGAGEEQVTLLAERLALLEIGEILDFDSYFHKYRSEAFRRDLWEAGDLAYGGLSDDGFMDFRAWLIAQGKDIYEQVLSDPDWLAQVVPIVATKWGKHAEIRLEPMSYVAMTAYEIKTGDDENMQRIFVKDPGLSDDWTPEEEKPLKFPNLWALFGDDVE